MADPKKRTFSAKIHAHDSGGAFVEIPFDVEQIFGSKRPKVKATFDGEPYRGTAVRMGTECHLLIVLKAIREKIGKDAGDKVRVTIEPDTAPRAIKAPKDLAAALKAKPAAAALWKELSYTHKREYVQWIEEAKKAETRERRVAKAIQMLVDGKRSR